MHGISRSTDTVIRPPASTVVVVCLGHHNSRLRGILHFGSDRTRAVIGTGHRVGARPRDLGLGYPPRDVVSVYQGVTLRAVRDCGPEHLRLPTGSIVLAADGQIAARPQ